MSSEIYKIQNYDLTKITEYFSQNENIDIEEVKLLEIEVKKYLYLLVKNKKEYGMSGMVDKYWHTFILFTKEYFLFCKYLGVNYIHHMPVISENDGIFALGNYNLFIHDYELEFKMNFPHEIWSNMAIIPCGGEDSGDKLQTAKPLVGCGGGGGGGGRVYFN